MKKLQVLGPGCPNCERLAENVKAAAEELGIEHELEKVTDIVRIADLGVMTTPALIVDGEIKFMGKVPSVEEIKGMLA
ncbi:MAG: thioredoxin family protein [Planctomycetota bacterium]|jgi:small redox-active disulfide protein 2